MNKVKDPGQGEVYSLRYVGSMVSDVHRTLLYGGIFMYPTDQRTTKGSCGCSEVIPMSFIVEAAGGKATDEKMDILDLCPTITSAVRNLHGESRGRGRT